MEGVGSTERVAVAVVGVDWRPTKLMTVTDTVMLSPAASNADGMVNVSAVNTVFFSSGEDAYAAGMLHV